jgi:hypothetical protein
MNAESASAPEVEGEAFQKWLFATEGPHGHGKPAPWYATLWLTGVDYFSSLGYAPGMAVLAAGYVAPIATVLLVLVTFLAAVPVYSMVAKHSPNGEGSISMIERLTVGWGRLGWIGKVLVLTLIGFAMTDFVITITLSTADATHHILHNPLLGPIVPDRPVLVTIALILGLCTIFLAGFQEAIAVSVLVGVPYILMSATIVGRGIYELTLQPERVTSWWSRVVHLDLAHLQQSVLTLGGGKGEIWVGGYEGGGAGALVLVSLAVFPKLALGMSGFETGVSVMGHVKAPDTAGRVRNTRRMLVTAAVIMCTLLLGSNFVATVLIDEGEFLPTGHANGRALAYLAHHYLGDVFGSVYDLSTVLILWFAGASAVAGLLSILPRYLPRFGMSPDWLGYRRPLVLTITAVCVVVTILFRADVEAQGAAYATGVLVLMASGAFAVLLAEPDFRRKVFFGFILAIFLYTLFVNVAERPEGIKIAGLFIAGVVLSSIWNRWHRASELRIQGVTFVDPESEAHWKRLQSMNDLVLIPLRSSTMQARQACEARRIHHQGEPSSTFVFLHVELIADTSQFQSPVRVLVRRDGEDWVVEVYNAVAVANAIAYVALELSVREVVIGLLDNGTPMTNAMMYLVFGTGEIGYAVRAVFMRLREEWLAEQQKELDKFDTERDHRERELLRDMVVLTPEERRARMDQLFVEERAKFIEEVKLKRLPHLILFE